MMRTFEFADQLIGIPYEWWNPLESMITDSAPFWSYANPVPAMDRIRSCNCAGLFNLLRRLHGLEIPGLREHREYAGGTYEWSRHLDSVKEAFDPTQEYAVGTLLLSDFRDIVDQGHLAVIHPSGQILHCRASQGVCLEPRDRVYSMFRFQYSIPYKDWMSQ